eukprot:scaffold23926_cov30-Phaeocystis_antarctica.AAC.1
MDHTCARRPEKWHRDEQDGCPSRVRIQSGPGNAAKGGVLPPRGSDCACESDGGDSNGQGTPQGGGG